MLTLTAVGTPSDHLESAYYLAGIAAGIAGSLAAPLGIRRWYLAKRRKWTEDGQQTQRHTEALEANTVAARENTEAIGALAGKFDGFATETRLTFADHAGQLRDHGRRLDHVEQRLERTPE